MCESLIGGWFATNAPMACMLQEPVCGTRIADSWFLVLPIGVDELLIAGGVVWGKCS